MDQFGVLSPRLRAMARTPAIPTAIISSDKPGGAVVKTPWRGAELRELREGEFSAIGVPAGAPGVLVEGVTKKSPAFKDGLRSADFIQRVNGREVRNVKEFLAEIGKFASGQSVRLTAIRDQQPIEYTVRSDSESKK
jgi:S1-C subfamily serine protease